MSKRTSRAKALREGGIGPLRAGLERGDLDPSEVVLASLASLEASRAENLTTELVSGSAPVRSGVSPSRSAGGAGPLEGVSLLVKDCFVDGGRPPTLGSRAPATWLEGTAEVLRRLRSAGAAIVGYANLHEWMVGVTSLVSAYGPVSNPRVPASIAGGSSGGSAAAVAGGHVAAAIGTDAGGSIRIPAACCGIVGFKPSWDAIPSEGFVDHGSPIDHIGPLTRTVEDAVLLFEVLSGRTIDLPNAQGLRFGLLEPALSASVEPELLAATEKVAHRLGGSQEIAIEGWEESRGAIAAFLLGDVARMLDRAYPDAAELLQPSTTRVLEVGREVDADRRAWAEKARTRARVAWDRVFASIDVLVTPTLPGRVPSVESCTRRQGGPSVEVDLVAWNSPMNLAGVPSISVPAGKLSDGSSFNVSLTAAQGNDATVLSAALLLGSLKWEA